MSQAKRYPPPNLSKGPAMKHQNERAVALILATLFLAGSASDVQSQQSNSTVMNNFELTVHVTEVKHQDGKVLIGVYNKSDGFPKELEKALLTAKTAPGKPKHTFRGLSHGNYAVVVIHDRNNNGKLDRNLLGMPKEPVGLSNYSVIGISNPPTFKTASFTLSSIESINIKLNQF